MATKSKVNIRDVAKASGYSVYTVSSVLNNKGDISPGTSRKVREAAQRLNYSLLGNVGAAEKITQRTIGIVLPEPGCLHNEFYNRAASTLIATVSKEDFNCKLFTEDDIRRRLDPEQSEGLHTLGCGGVVIFCPRQNYQEYIEQLLKRSVAVALVRRRCPEQRGLCQMVDDDTANMTSLLKYLHDERGCGRMLMVGDKHNSSGSQTGRSGAFLDFASRNLAAKDCLLTSEGQWEDPDKLREFIRFIRDGEKCTICCWTDYAAMNVLLRLNQQGLSVPGDVCLTGYNDDPVTRMAIPSITSMHIPVEEMIVSACGYLLKNQNPRELPASEVREFKHRLIERASTGQADLTPASF